MTDSSFGKDDQGDFPWDGASQQMIGNPL